MGMVNSGVEPLMPLLERLDNISGLLGGVLKWILAISSEIATTILAMVILGIDLLMPKEKSRKCLGYITVIGLVGVFIAIFNQYHLGNAPTFVEIYLLWII